MIPEIRTTRRFAIVMSVLAVLALALALTFGHQLEDPLTSDTAALVVLVVWCLAGAAAAITAIVDAYISPEGELPVADHVDRGDGLRGARAGRRDRDRRRRAPGSSTRRRPAPTAQCARAGSPRLVLVAGQELRRAIANTPSRDPREQEDDTGDCA